MIYLSHDVIFCEQDLVKFKKIMKTAAKFSYNMKKKKNLGKILMAKTKKAEKR